ncbi:uncharacterized protein EDB93DRAFT_1099278 [Suillus bovinus]|uniref:uncharacterized protein n=1 Tax=Suillus bovinus TaxID=48563 RepID=UPI001B87E031|nr:uncharacterized protein EDB93DRAFT_1099278 [Suillus bovinus]KAG2159826.1 hypothetical protein EDB93DRAFT_1099278 [Suillus bovinus]
MAMAAASSMQTPSSCFERYELWKYPSSPMSFYANTARSTTKADIFRALSSLLTKSSAMRAHAQPGINVDVAADPEANFAPLALQTQNIDEVLDPISLDEIDIAFALLKRKTGRGTGAS